MSDHAQVRLVSILDAPGFRMQVEVKTGVDLKGEDVWSPLPTKTPDETGYAIRVQTGKGRIPIAVVPIALLDMETVEIGKNIKHSPDQARDILDDLLSEIAGPVGLIRVEARRDQPNPSVVQGWSQKIRDAMAKARERLGQAQEAELG